MLKLFTLCFDTCINSLYKTVFYFVEGCSAYPLTFSCYRVHKIKSSWTILVNDRFKMSPKKKVKR